MVLGMTSLMAEHNKSLASFAPTKVRLYDETGRLKDTVIKRGTVSGIRGGIKHYTVLERGRG